MKTTINVADPTRLTQDVIWSHLDSSQAAVEAALLAIYDRQLQEAKLAPYMNLANRVGFDSGDLMFCSSLCSQLRTGRSLTPKQHEVARRKCKKYWRQIVTLMTTALPDVMVEAPAPTPAEIPAHLLRAGDHPSPISPMQRIAAEAYGSW